MNRELLTQADNDFIQNNFCIKMKTKTICKGCSRNSEIMEELFIIPVPFIPKAELSQSLESFFSPCEIKSWCQKCNTHSTVKKEKSIIDLPKNLIFQQQKVELPESNSFPFENLKVNNFCEDIDDCSSYNLHAIAVYKCYSQHREPTIGHYYSYIKKKNNKWYKFDDDREIKEMQIKDILNDSAYLLFYENNK